MERKENKFKILYKKWFENDSNRRIATIIIILPFLIVISICGIKVFNEAKNLLSLASEETTTNNENFKINDGNNEEGYILRDNATNIQKEYFATLKQLYEKPNDTQTKEDFAETVVKCFIADFYTWSNKYGQYDVGGMYYVYTPQRYTIYIQARDQFYKYLNSYINEYGSKALLEVESVEATAVHNDLAFTVKEENAESGEEEWNEYNTFYVTASWTYVAKDSGFDLSKYNTNGYFVVIDYKGRYEITYAGNEVYTGE